MCLRSGLGPEPRWGSLQRCPRPCRIPPCSRPSSSNFGPSSLRSPPTKKVVGSVSNQNCCKGLRFTEKIEKHCLTLLFIQISAPQERLYSTWIGYVSYCLIVYKTTYRTSYRLFYDRVDNRLPAFSHNPRWLIQAGYLGPG